ncbi:UNVERIFIED_CONTAM: putative AC transposase [Sesamum radiatum]|uniref:AC transposase n=1 Tax=Sesamum radiatum TaxID=300843 RepID=A0AAW2SJX8_SESRA
MSTSRSESSQPTSLHSSGHSGDNEEVTNQSRSSKRKQSIVWEHFTKVRGVNDSLHAKCNYCEKLLSGGSAYGTTHLKKHLNNACPKFKLEHRIGLSGSPRNEFKFDQVKSRKDLAIACIKHKYPFNIGEHEYFEIFLSGLNPDFKLPCRNTIRSDVIEVYEEEKVKIYKLLDGLRCKVSLTTDIWTSEHSHVAYCCLTVHFVDDSWELQKKILAFRKMPYPHDGETLFSFMTEMILEWNLDKKLFSIVVDNATNNDVMIRKVKDWILYDLLVARDVDLLHVRCSAHILNLIVQDGLNEIRGLIDKIRETVRYLNKSPAASQKFEMALSQCNLTDKRQVAMDVPNRWNSTYELLATALPLKEAFSRLQRIDKNYHWNPSESEWDVAGVVHECLQIFYEVTHHFSGRKWCYESRVSNNQKSELESYLEEARFPRAESFNILDWWKTSSPRLPVLAKIARDILAVPATTVASEAALSVGGRIIDESRTCLLPDEVEALVVTDDWIESIPKRTVHMESSGTQTDNA